MNHTVLETTCARIHAISCLIFFYSLSFMMVSHAKAPGNLYNRRYCSKRVST